MTATERLLAERYGRRPSNSAQTRRKLLIALAIFVSVCLVFIAWAAAGRSRATVTWYDLGTVTITDSTVSTRIRVVLPPDGSAVCTVKAVNTRLIEVGRQEVVITPDRSGVQSQVVTLSTSERAMTAGIKSCVRT